MRLVTFESSRLKKPQAGIVLNERVIPLGQLGDFPKSMIKLIRRGPRAWQGLQEATRDADAASLPLDDVTLLPPLPRPSRNVMCLGWNYAAHVEEKAAGQAVPLPEHPIVFTKAPSTVNRPFGEMVYDPEVTSQLDWEVELAVIIGLAGKAIPVERALEHVFGYTILNDLTARDLQNRHQQFFLGKSLDGACPMGPWIVTRDAIEDPQTLTLRSYVNGELKQDGKTADQIFSVAETISVLSQGMMLQPGDIIATGTPGGVGAGRTPPQFLGDGDVVRCEISGIGHIETTIRAAWVNTCSHPDATDGSTSS